MGKIVGGFWVPHDPVMFVAPNAPDAAQSEVVWGAYAQCAERLAALDLPPVVKKKPAPKKTALKKAAPKAAPKAATKKIVAAKPKAATKRLATVA